MLGVFLASFSLALVSHAPGGLGVLEYSFLKAMPDAPPADVIAALLVFRLLYLIVPLLFSLFVVVALRARADRRTGARDSRDVTHGRPIATRDDDALIVVDMQNDFCAAARWRFPMATRSCRWSIG